MLPGNKQKYTKNFGLLVGSILLIIALYPLIKGYSINILILTLACLSFISAMFFQQIFEKPALLWFKLGNILHKVISPIIMLIVYITSIVLVALLMKIIRRDGLDKKLNPKIDSYWIIRKNSIKDNFNLNDQF